MSGLACPTPAPHAHTDVPGPAWIDAILARLQCDGNRITKPRLAVLRWISNQQAPFTAEDAVAAIDEEIGAGSRATIYRFLLLLREGGWLARLHRTDQDHALVRKLPGHHQVVCTNCGDTMVIGGCDLTPLIGQSLAGTGFSVQGHQLEIYGRCRECA